MRASIPDVRVPYWPLRERPESSPRGKTTARIVGERRRSFGRRRSLERVGEAVAAVEGDEVVEWEKFEAAHDGESVARIGVADE
jgi:hypothetical protein